MSNSRIPMLQPNASAQDIVIYLNWLENSPYAYHIDDCPTEIIWKIETSEEYTNLLKWNHDIMWRYECENISDFLWNNYGEDISEDENF